MKVAPSTTLWYLSLALASCLLLAGHSQRIEAQSSAATPGSISQNVAANASRSVFLPLTRHDRGATPFGVAMYRRVDQANGVAQMQAAGASRVTVALDWGSVEPTEGARNWSDFDASMRNAEAAKMEVFVLFMGDPTWARLPGQNVTDPAKRLAIVRAMVDRYDCDGINDMPERLCVRDWSFYAEPDADYGPNAPSGTKGYWGSRPQAYAQMIASVADVVHQENPYARVMIGGLAYDWFKEDGQGGLFRRSFLPGVLQELNASYGGAARYLDQMAVHYYPIQFASIGDKVREVRTIMQQHGVGHLTLVMPEAGYWSDPAASSSEAKQAARLVKYYVEALSLDVAYLSWYTVFDGGPGTETSGLFRGSDLNSPKPAYAAYQTITRELAGAQFARTVNQPNAVGGVFRMPSGGQEKSVVWAVSGSANIAFPYRCVRVVDTTGAITAGVADGTPGLDQDGRVNNVVTLRVTDSPVYVEACR